MSTLNELDRIGQLPGAAEQLIRSISEDLAVIEEAYAQSAPSDIRRSALHKLLNAAFPAHIGVLILSEELVDVGWWIRPGRTLYKPAAMGILIDEYEKSLKVALLMATFIATESSFRLIAAAPKLRGARILPNQYKHIADWLFQELELDGDLIVAMDLMRMLRNTLHNNSVHTGASKVLRWRDIPYRFLSGRPITFLTWDLLFALIQQISVLTRTVVLHPKIFSLPTIRDSYGYQA